MYGFYIFTSKLGRVKRIWYLSPMRAAKVQASLRIRAVSPEPPLLAHTSSESWGTFRQKARSLAPLNGWACAVKICHDGMLEDGLICKLIGAWFLIQICLLFLILCLCYECAYISECIVYINVFCSFWVYNVLVETDFQNPNYQCFL